MRHVFTRHPSHPTASSSIQQHPSGSNGIREQQRQFVRACSLFPRDQWQTVAILIANWLLTVSLTSRTLSFSKVPIMMNPVFCSANSSVLRPTNFTLVFVFLYFSPFYFLLSYVLKKKHSNHALIVSSYKHTHTYVFYILYIWVYKYILTVSLVGSGQYFWLPW